MGRIRAFRIWDLRNRGGSSRTCRRLVDEALLAQYEGGETADQLFERYKSFGDDPFVVALDPAPNIEFSAWTYAQRRALELVAPGPEGRHNRQSVADRKRAFARS